MGKGAVVSLTWALVLGIWLLAILWRRRIFRIFPFFFAYVLSSVLIEIVKLAIINNYVAYFIVFWSAEALYALLSVLALHEVFRQLFRPFFSMYSWFWLLFPGVGAITAGLSILRSVNHPPVQASPLISLILSIEVAVNVLQCALFLVFLAIRRILKMRGPSYAWGIVEGFAAIALAGITYALRSEYGKKYGFLAEYGTAVAYIVAVALWLDTFIRAPRLQAEWGFAVTPKQLLEELRSYMKLLKHVSDRRK